MIAGTFTDHTTSAIGGRLLNTDGTLTSFAMAGSIGIVANGINKLGQIVGHYSVLGPSLIIRISRSYRVFRDTSGAITLVDASYFASTQINGVFSTGTLAASFSRNGDGLSPYRGLFGQCILCA